MPRRRAAIPTRPRFTLRLTDAEHNALRRAAFRDHKPANTIVREALVKHLKLAQAEEPAA